jgi:hypothetical protein
MSAAMKRLSRQGDGSFYYLFPQEVTNQNYMMLQVLEKSRGDKFEVEEGKSVGRVFIFPIPANLSVASKTDYESKGLGALGAMGAGRLNTTGAMDDVTSALMNGASDVLGGIAGTGGSMTADAQTSGAVQSASTAAVVGVAAFAGSKMGKKLGVSKLAGGGLLGATAGASVLESLGLRAGIAVNPHLAVLFKGVGLRTFAFQYKFVARNQQESNQLRDIIKRLNYHMHPDYFAGNFAFKYPDEFRIEFSQNRKEWLFNLKDCVMTDMTVNYNGEGMPLFFEDIGGPVSIDISMSFQETKIFTKRDYAEDYEIERDPEAEPNRQAGFDGPLFETFEQKELRQLIEGSD